MQAPNDAPAPRPGKLPRRIFLIDPSFQLKYSLMFAGAGTVVSALFGSMMYLVHVDALGAAMRVAPPELQRELAARDATFFWLMATVTVLMAVGLGLFGILVTHRVAGPVYVMTRYVGEVAEGRYPQMRALRRFDALQDFFERFHRAVETLRAREEEEARILDGAVNGLKAQVASAPGAQAMLGSLAALSARKRKSLGVEAQRMP